MGKKKVTGVVLSDSVVQNEPFYAIILEASHAPAKAI